jgi:hypothetical protein
MSRQSGRPEGREKPREDKYTEHLDAAQMQFPSAVGGARMMVKHLGHMQTVEGAVRFGWEPKTYTGSLYRLPAPGKCSCCTLVRLQESWAAAGARLQGNPT